MSHKVIASFESSDGSHCVDIFTREVSSFGFEEFRGESVAFTFGRALSEGGTWRAMASMAGHWRLRSTGKSRV